MKKQPKQKKVKAKTKGKDKGKGIVYLVSNPCFPDWVKVGMVTPEKVAKFGEKAALEDRLSTLSGTNVPQPFALHYAVALENAGDVERRIHSAYDGVRENNREFFKIDPDSVRVVMEMFDGQEVNLKEESWIPPEEVVPFHEEQQRAAGNRERKRQQRTNFQFSTLDIPIGAELTFIYDESITAEVVDGNEVIYEDEEMALSAAANAALKKLERYKSAVSGPLYWKYEGETVEVRRKRMEREKADE